MMRLILIHPKKNNMLIRLDIIATTLANIIGLDDCFTTFEVVSKR